MKQCLEYTFIIAATSIIALSSVHAADTSKKASRLHRPPSPPTSVTAPTRPNEVPKDLFFSSHCSPEYIQTFLAEDQKAQTPQQQHTHKKKKSATPLVQHPWFTPAVGIGILTVALGAVATYFWWKKKQ